MTYAAEIRVRYNECDMQGIVFNANYLIYVDEALDRWMISTIGLGGFDMVVKRATVEWQSPARHGDTLRLVPMVTRWGSTSFDITVTGTVEDRPVFVATMLYVNVVPGTKTPTPVPDHIRAALS